MTVIFKVFDILFVICSLDHFEFFNRFLKTCSCKIFQTISLLLVLYIDKTLKIIVTLRKVQISLLFIRIFNIYIYIYIYIFCTLLYFFNFETK